MGAGHGNKNWYETCWHLQSPEIIWDKCKTLRVQQSSAVCLFPSQFQAQCPAACSCQWPQHLPPGFLQEMLLLKSRLRMEKLFKEHVLVTVWYLRRGFLSVHDSKVTWSPFISDRNAWETWLTGTWSLLIRKELRKCGQTRRKAENISSPLHLLFKKINKLKKKCSKIVRSRPWISLKEDLGTNASCVCGDKIFFLMRSRDISHVAGDQNRNFKAKPDLFLCT